MGRRRKEVEKILSGRRRRMPESRRKIQHSICFPPKMFEALKAAAEENGWTVSVEVIERLEREEILG